VYNFFCIYNEVVVINSTPKMVNVPCDDNVVNLSYITIVPFLAYTLMLECFFGSMVTSKEFLSQHLLVEDSDPLVLLTRFSLAFCHGKILHSKIT
jgi:hypothetical protein